MAVISHNLNANAIRQVKLWDFLFDFSENCSIIIIESEGKKKQNEKEKCLTRNKNCSIINMLKGKRYPPLAQLVRAPSL